MWRLVILPSALKELAALPAKSRLRIDQHIGSLAQIPDLRV
jgi:mRNA-degrading endonuclease RelE of RelBE toxin-antitoxin system